MFSFNCAEDIGFPPCLSIEHTQRQAYIKNRNVAIETAYIGGCIFLLFPSTAVMDVICNIIEGIVIKLAIKARTLETECWHVQTSLSVTFFTVDWELSWTGMSTGQSQHQTGNGNRMSPNVKKRAKIARSTTRG
jgi:hypothetical protein